MFISAANRPSCIERSCHGHQVMLSKRGLLNLSEKFVERKANTSHDAQILGHSSSRSRLPKSAATNSTFLPQQKQKCRYPESLQLTSFDHVTLSTLSIKNVMGATSCQLQAVLLGKPVLCTVMLSEKGYRSSCLTSPVLSISVKDKKNPEVT